MASLKVDDIVRGRRDSTDAEILTVYAKVSTVYAIYKTAERVMIHFADDPEKGSEQRQALVPLSPLLGEINGLVDGWRISHKQKLRAKANIFDRRVADALLLGLQGHAAQAQPLLQEIKNDLLEERTSPARVDYAVVAAGVTVLMVLVACVMTWEMIEPIYNYQEEANSLWLGFGAGAVGALFFTCLRLRTRDLNTDLQPWENRADAAARILIGAIAGAVIVALLRSKLVSVSLGTENIGGDPVSWLKLAVAGFLGGYSERLVTTVLDRASSAASRSGAQTLVGTTTTTTTTSGVGVPSENNPLRTAPAAPPPPPGGGGDVPTGEGDDVDSCGSDVELDPAEATDDIELPPAAGGVEEAEEPPAPPPSPPPPPPPSG